MSLTDEPQPRTEPRPWAPFEPPVARWEPLPPPSPCPARDFRDVLISRLSAIGGPVDFDRIAELLWHAVSRREHGQIGRAGIPVERRASPSSGGLHPIHVVCLPAPPDERVLVYDPAAHSFGRLSVDAATLVLANAGQVAAVIGGKPVGWTLRFIGDYDKIGAAYENGWSLLLRDAGCLLMTICVCAEWLELKACPLGFLGQSLCDGLGFPDARFRGVGGVQISA